MQTSIERRRLTDTMADEPVNPWLVLAQCAAGLMIVIALVVMVVSDERVLNGRTGTSAKPLRADAAAAPISEVYRRKVFDERRARFQADPARRDSAHETLAPMAIR